MRGRPNKEEKYHNYISQLEAKEKRESFRQIFFLCIIATVGLGGFLLLQIGRNTSNSTILVQEDYQLVPESQNSISKTEASFETGNAEVLNLEGEQSNDISEGIGDDFVTENNSLKNTHLEERGRHSLREEKASSPLENPSLLSNSREQPMESEAAIEKSTEVSESIGSVSEAEDPKSKEVESNLGERSSIDSHQTTQKREDKVKVESSPTPIKKEAKNIDGESKMNPTITKPINKASKSVKPQALAEKMPQFPGGVSAMNEFLSKRINYPLAAKDHKVEGKVYLQFVVESNGSLTNMKVARGLGYGCDEEAVRVARKMPKWQPGEDKGQKVPVIYTLAVQFRIQ